MPLGERKKKKVRVFDDVFVDGRLALGEMKKCEIPPGTTREPAPRELLGTMP